MSYKLRCDITDENRQALRAYVRKISQKWMRVKELGTTGENPHYHFYLETDVKDRTVRSHLRSHCGLVGNGAYSFKKTESMPMAYLAYMLKEGKPVYKGFSDQERGDIEAYDEKVKLSIAEKKKNKLSLTDKIDDYIGPDDWDMGYKVIQYHLENRLVIRKAQIEAIVMTIKFRRGGPDEIRGLISLYEFKF